MAHVDQASTLQVTVIFSPSAGVVDERVLTLPSGAMVTDAMAASQLTERYPQLDFSAFVSGIWGALCERSQALHQGDRVELYRPLRVDPKEARRRRHMLQRNARQTR